MIIKESVPRWTVCRLPLPGSYNWVIAASSNRTMIPNTYPNSDKRVFYSEIQLSLVNFINPGQLKCWAIFHKTEAKGWTFGPQRDTHKHKHTKSHLSFVAYFNTVMIKES